MNVMAIHAVAESVRIAGAEGVPAGHLYALLLDRFDNVAAFESAVSTLTRAGLVKRDGHVLRWSGPLFPDRVAAEVTP